MPTLEKYRTCKYCVKIFKTKELFRKHWTECPARIEAGFVPPTELYRKTEGIFLVKKTPFRSSPFVNQTEDMLRVVFRYAYMYVARNE